MPSTSSVIGRPPHYHEIPPETIKQVIGIAN
jgi:hypothetical protein